MSTLVQSLGAPDVGIQVERASEREASAQARARGLDTIDGLEMLIGQAALAFELFFGTAPPRDERREAELRALLAA